MKVVSLNINNFGGYNEHLEMHKEIFGGYQGIHEWDKIDKKQNVEGIKNFLLDHAPDIIVIQEFDLNSKEAKFFDNIMKLNGYLLKSEKPQYKRPSMTVFYIKDTLAHIYISVGHTNNGRAYAIRVGEFVIYGTHVPPKYDEKFWEELHDFAEKNKNEKYVFIGDFNTINNKNMIKFVKLLDFSIDAWKAKGNDNKMSIAGDYAIISEQFDIDTVMIESADMDQYTDHPAIVLTI